MEKGVQPGLDRPVQPADPVPGLLQGGAGPLGDLPVGLEAPVDAHREPLEVGQPLTHEGEAGNDPRPLGERLPGTAEGEQRLGAAGQLLRLEEPALLGTLDGAADVRDPAEWQAQLVLKERPCLVHPGECFPDGRGVVEE